MLIFSLKKESLDPDLQLAMSCNTVVPDPECESEILDVKLIFIVHETRKHKHVGLKLKEQFHAVFLTSYLHYFPQLVSEISVCMCVCVLSSPPLCCPAPTYQSAVLLFHTRPLPVIQGLFASLPHLSSLLPSVPTSLPGPDLKTSIMDKIWPCR
jgi:hypothetical protein